MFEIFEQYVGGRGNLSRDELDMIRSHAIERKIQRRDFMLREGEICQYKIFVTKGLLRAYCVNEEGSESILRFAPERVWVTDHQSFTRKAPSSCYIEALEDSEVLLWTLDSIEFLLKAAPGFKAITDQIISQTLEASHHRILMNIGSTSEEKYEDFIRSMPDVFNRVPLHMVASYLGVSRETLSRIRHARMRQIKD